MTTISPICNCGNAIGHIYPAFREEKMRQLREIRGKYISTIKKDIGDHGDIVIADSDVDVTGVSMRSFIEKCHLDGRECCIALLMGHIPNLPIDE